MSAIATEIKEEVQAIKADLAATFDAKIRDLDRKADAKWDELQKSPDAVLGESLKAVLADAEKAREQKSAAFQAALTERMDELETKAKERNGGADADPVAEAVKAIGDWDFDPREQGKKSTLVLPLKAVTTITNANANGATFANRAPGIREIPQDPLVMRSVIAGGTIDGYYFKYERELAGSLEGDADYQGGGTPAEGAVKPTMDIYTEMVTAEVSTIAVTSRVSQQVFDDRSAFISFLRNRMGYRVERFLDREILTGAGTSGELDGINTNATAYDDSHVGKADATIQHLDIIRFARNQVELANFTPNFTALHPTDWATIETKKDGDERYLIGDPKTGGSSGVGRVGSVWGMPVITTAGQTSDAFTVGDGMEAQLFMRQGLQVLASTEDQDNFVKNLVTLRAELRALLAIYSALAFVTGDFSDSIAAV